MSEVKECVSGVKIYLDDVRTPSPGSVDFTICRTAEEAIKFIDSLNVVLISFDHDLGTELTGYSVACHIEERVYLGKMKCPRWIIHSANPVGRKQIQSAMESAMKYQKYREDLKI